MYYALTRCPVCDRHWLRDPDRYPCCILCALALVNGALQSLPHGWWVDTRLFVTRLGPSYIYRAWLYPRPGPLLPTLDGAGSLWMSNVRYAYGILSAGRAHLSWPDGVLWETGIDLDEIAMRAWL